MAAVKKQQGALSCKLCGALAEKGRLDLCQYCGDYCGHHGMMPLARIPDLLKDIDQRFDQARQALHNHRQVDARQVVGWYHHLNQTGKVGISSTAYALHALSLLSPRDPDLHRIAEGMLNHADRIDMPAADPTMFAWPMQSCPGVPLVEPTCYVLQQLLGAGLLARADEHALGALRWLLTQQGHDGYWSLPNQAEGNVYLTALVCQVLSDFEYKEAAMQLTYALQWLLRAKNGDGGWGMQALDGASNAWCTSHALIALHDRAKGSHDTNLVDGVGWLRKNPEKWSEFIFEEYPISSPGGGQVMAHYQFQPLPLVLIALDKAGIRPLAPDMLHAVEELLQREKDGVWIWSNNNRKTIFNLSHSVQALSAIRTRFNNADQIRAMMMLVEETAERHHSSPVAEMPPAQQVPAGRPGGAMLSARHVKWLFFLPGIAMLFYAALPANALPVILSRLKDVYEGIKENAWIFSAGLLVLGVAGKFSWNLAWRWFIAYAGVVVTFLTYLKQGENGILSVLASAAAAFLLVLITYFWNEKPARGSDQS